MFLFSYFMLDIGFTWVTMRVTSGGGCIYSCPTRLQRSHFPRVKYMSPEVKRQRLIESYIRRGVKRSQAYYDFLASQPVMLVGPREWRYYSCAHCHQFFSRGKLDLDHMIPVVDPACGFVDWNSYVERAYCSSSNYQHLCRPCHRNKSREEGKIRSKTLAAKKLKTSANPREG